VNGVTRQCSVRCPARKRTPPHYRPITVIISSRRRLDLDDIEPALEEENGDRLLALDDAIRQLEAEHPRRAELGKLRFFAGLTALRASAALGDSTSTAEKDWAYARSRLRVAVDRRSGHRP
jgi:DNA-directed RNA polymerase specialized sigma24 family protein